MYADGQKTSKIKSGINKENFDKITTEYADYILEIGDYIDSHQTDFLSGKTFSDFDDYENSFEEFYHWANNGKYYLVVRVEGNDRKSFFAVAESETGIDGFRFWDYPVIQKIPYSWILWRYFFN